MLILDFITVNILSPKSLAVTVVCVIFILANMFIPVKLFYVKKRDCELRLRERRIYVPYTRFSIKRNNKIFVF